jgi:hypothetical protein
MTNPDAAKKYRQLVQSIELFNKTFNVQHRAWQKELSEAEDSLSFIENLKDQPSDGSLLLQPGESLLLQIPAGLIEERAGQSRYVGGHSGISVPIGSIGGHSIRYSVGSSRGHIERGAPVETEIDRGIFSITNKRLIFAGNKETRDSEFKKIIGISHPYRNRVVISSSGRQKATVLSFDPEFTKVLRLMILIAQADFQGKRDELIQAARNDINEIKNEEPKVLAIPTEAEASSPSYEPPVPLSKATTKLMGVMMWVVTASAMLTSSIPPLSALLALTSAYFGWKVFITKPEKKTSLIVAGALTVLALLAAISYMSKGQFFVIPSE